MAAQQKTCHSSILSYGGTLAYNQMSLLDKVQIARLWVCTCEHYKEQAGSIMEVEHCNKAQQKYTPGVLGMSVNSA